MSHWAMGMQRGGRNRDDPQSPAVRIQGEPGQARMGLHAHGNGCSERSTANSD
eukprot:CAMPEP_0183430358 /NCGR_PEP_ID=MMETSP0370-20130417/50944_1 /TAXON_ID=268820 /ORGANISM="Peridinium aciculiferum, Strain PAER-2" /LENGTH=52 /DNA_ID=CAMNT_0025615687 /DNA_START=16 /DNA_END=171 /DNA_ORIENTATION=-